MTEDTMEVSEIEDEYDSGPFCQHYSDPSDCDDICFVCGHECREHDNWNDSPHDCSVDGCKCEDFKDKPE